MLHAVRLIAQGEALHRIFRIPGVANRRETFLAFPAINFLPGHAAKKGVKPTLQTMMYR